MESPNAVPSIVLGKKGLNPEVKEMNSSKAKDETPVIVLDPVNESSEGENIEESNLQEFKPEHTHSVEDPSKDSCKGKNVDESDAQLVPVPEACEDEEYACKYCHRKFSNKQSLGGHQNAHKFERAMEKDAASEAQESRAGYFSGMKTSPLSSHHHGSLKRSYEYMNRPLNISWPYHEFSHSAGWPPNVVPTVPVPRVSHFATAQPRAASSSSSSRPVSQGLSPFHQSRISLPGRNAGVNNVKVVPGTEEDDSGLDLTLRL